MTSNLRGGLRCPTCRQPHSFSEANNVAAVPRNFALIGSLEGLQLRGAAGGLLASKSLVIGERLPKDSRHSCCVCWCPKSSQSPSSGVLKVSLCTVTKCETIFLTRLLLHVLSVQQQKQQASVLIYRWLSRSCKQPRCLLRRFQSSKSSCRRLLLPPACAIGCAGCWASLSWMATYAWSCASTSSFCSSC